MSGKAQIRPLALLCICLVIGAGNVFGQSRGIYRDRSPRAETAPASAHRIPLAVKTNLLFDATTMLNIELEAPVAHRWSVAGEWVFPWWLSNRKQWALQLGMGTVEGRWWWRRTLPMTGWFIGIYAGAGYYDFERRSEGRQGEFAHAGVSGGFAHTISRNGDWRLEYSLGMGHLVSKYRKYDAYKGTGDEWYLVRIHNDVYRWWGPTRAKVSLVWTPDLRRIFGRTQKGGGK